MGVRFDLSSSNVMAYLTSPSGYEPRITYEALLGFLNTIADDHPARPRLISSDHRWAHKLQAAAKRASNELTDHQRRYDEVVEPETLHQLLGPLARVLGSYDLYVMPVGTWRDSDTLDRFGREAAMVPGRGILVLIPDFYHEESLRVFDPNSGVADALRRRSEWPGALFLLRNGDAAFAPLGQAYDMLVEFVRLFEAAPDQQSRMEYGSDILRDSRGRAEPTVRILHLSDLHLGTDRAEQTEVLLRASLRKELPSIHQTVITGDLFDQPKRRFAQRFKNFSDNLQLQGARPPIIVPGNHDQRVFGNALFGIGRRLRQLADLRWRTIVEDPETRMVFLCFDSSRSGNFARGEISTEQLVSVATDYEVANSGGRYDEYLKVALLHHHPYPWGQRDEASILGNGGMPDLFVEMKDGENFMTWCAGRGISLVLHGHKHVPRLINESIAVGNERVRVTTVACGTSLGANGRPLSYNIVDWNPEAQAWSVDFKVDRGDGQGFRSAVIEAHV